MRRALALILTLTSLALTGCGDDDSQDGDGAGAGPPAGTSEADATSQPMDAAGSAEAAPRLYFTAGEQFSPVERELPASGSEAAATKVVSELVDGPTGREAEGADGARTAIPEGTEVRDVEIEGDTAEVELSERFLAGVPEEDGARSPAENAELNARLGQVTYTLTSLRGVDAAKVSAGGVPVEPALDREEFAKPKGGAPEITKPRGEPVPDTRRVQRRLARLGYLPTSAVDGLAGYRTEQAVIAFQSWEGLARDGVVGPVTSAALREAKPPRPRARDAAAKRIEVYREKGVALLVRDGKLVRAIHVSAGAPGTETPRGSYEVFRKEVNSWSVPFSQWLPYASYFNQGIAFHEYASVPTFPASHGCVRVPSPEAKYVYRFAKLGTAVVVRN